MAHICARKWHFCAPEWFAHRDTHGGSLQRQRNEMVLQCVVSVVFHKGSALCYAELSPEALGTMLGPDSDPSAALHFGVSREHVASQWCDLR